MLIKSKWNLILQCCEGSNFSLNTSMKVKLSIPDVNETDRGTMLEFLQMAPPPKWPFLQYTTRLTATVSLFSAKTSSENTDRAHRQPWPCVHRTHRIGVKSAHKQQRGHPWTSWRYCPACFSWGIYDISLRRSCRAACCWRPRWGTCNRTWAPLHSRYDERRRWRCASGHPPWWPVSSSWARRSGWWSGRRCHALWHPQPHSHRCETCNSQSPLRKKKNVKMFPTRFSGQINRWMFEACVYPPVVHPVLTLPS